jgi:hypothetical protein
MNYYRIEDSISHITPDYANQDLRNSRIPDYRNLLYWNPDITFDQGDSNKIEFYTSDDEGIYEIEIFGIYKDGSILSENSNFKVVKSN